MADRTDLAEEFEGEPEADEEVDHECQHDGDEEHQDGPDQIANGGAQEYRGDEAEDADGGEADNEVGEFEHHFLSALPEFVLGFPVSGIEFADEGPKEDGEGDDTEQLAVVGGGIDNVGRKHALENLKQVA